MPVGIKATRTRQPKQNPESTSPSNRLESFDCFVLMAIRPHHSRGIFLGTKKVELRRTNVSFPPRRTLVFVYGSSPTQAVVGAFTVQDIHRQEIDQLWKAVGRLRIQGLMRLAGSFGRGVL